LDARIGVTRALTEMNQFMPAVMTTDQRGNTQYGCHDAVLLDWWRNSRAESHRHLVPRCCRAKKVAGPSGPAPRDVKMQLQDCFTRVEKLGHEVLVLDQTRPDIGLPVAKVIVPGLRHFWARFAPGRLYDVPVKLGWQKRRLAENELNPIPIFI
jgi:ribosomal protein S12 methylthiotransferase accessory factor